MGFVGEVNKLGDDLVRPHDIQILLEPDGTTQEGQIERVAHLGFEVRVELILDDGRRLAVQTTRQDAEERELESGPDRLPAPGPRRGRSLALSRASDAPRPRARWSARRPASAACRRRCRRA